MRHKQIFVNLPVKDVERSKRFYGAMGYEFNPQFSNEQALSMIISDDIYAMLLVEEFFQTFTPRGISDAPCDDRGADLPVLREQGAGRRADRQGPGRRRHRAARAAGHGLHVLAGVGGPGRAQLGG